MKFAAKGSSARPQGRDSHGVRFLMHTKAILVAMSLLVTAATAVFASPVAQGKTLINDQLTEETGPTSILGGGDHMFVRFNPDAAFGVVYGRTANPNNVYLVAIKARYLGVAQVVDPQNRSVSQNRPIKIYTLYAVKLDSIVEFRDRNANSVADYGRLYNSTTSRFSDYFNRIDTLYKKVDLHTNWTAGTIVRSSGPDYRSWTFNLTAGNLSYTAIANSSANTALPTPLVRFTFHLNASLEQIDNATVPQLRITVDTVGGRTVVTNVSRMADLVVSGKAVHYDVKWDQLIGGWSYAIGNGNLNQRRLLLELGTIVGNLIPAAIVDAWFDARAMGRIGETGSASFNTSTGTVRANDTTPFPTVRRLQSPLVDFGGNWTRIARLVWVSDSVVDGATYPVFGQIVAGVRFAAIGESGNAFVGFALLAGLSFRGGASIAHDPTVTADVQADLVLPGSGTPGSLVFALVGGVAVVAVILLILVLVTRRRKRQTLPPPPPET